MDEFYTFDNMEQFDGMNTPDDLNPDVGLDPYGMEPMPLMPEPVTVVHDPADPDLRQQVNNMQQELRLMKTMLRRLEREVMELSSRGKTE